MSANENHENDNESIEAGTFHGDYDDYNNQDENNHDQGDDETASVASNTKTKPTTKKKKKIKGDSDHSSNSSNSKRSRNPKRNQKAHRSGSDASNQSEEIKDDDNGDDEEENRSRNERIDEEESNNSISAEKNRHDDKNHTKKSKKDGTRKRSKSPKKREKQHLHSNDDLIKEQYRQLYPNNGKMEMTKGSNPIAVGIPVDNQNQIDEALTMPSGPQKPDYEQLKNEYRRLQPLSSKPTLPPTAEEEHSDDDGDNNTNTNYDHLKNGYRHLPHPTAINEHQPSVSSREASQMTNNDYSRIKDEYRRLDRNNGTTFHSNEASISETSNENNRSQMNNNGYNRIKDEYRRLDRNHTSTSQSNEASNSQTDNGNASEDYNHMKAGYRALDTNALPNRPTGSLQRSTTYPATSAPSRSPTRASFSSGSGQGRGTHNNFPPPPTLASDSSNPYANYNPYVPGAHSIGTSGSIENRPTLQSGHQYCSIRTNADAYLVSAHLVKDRSERFFELENRQVELERQIEQKTKLINEHEELLTKFLSGEISPNTYKKQIALNPGSSHGTTPTLPSAPLAAATATTAAPVIVEATPLESIDELERQIAEREKRVKEREKELEELAKQMITQKTKGMKKIKNLIFNKRPTRKRQTSASSSGGDGENDNGNGTSSHHYARRDSSGSHSYRADPSEFSESFSNMYEGTSVRSSFAVAGSEELEVGKESYHSQHNNNNEHSGDEDDEKQGIKRESLYFAPEHNEFDGLAVSQLKELAAEYNVDISSCFDRLQLVDKLKDAGVPAKAPSKKASKPPPPPPSPSPSPSSTKKHWYSPDIRKSPSVKDVKQQPGNFKAVGKCPFAGFSIAELKEMAEKAQINLSFCIDRGEIVTELLNGGIEPRTKTEELEKRMKRKIKLGGMLGSSNHSNHSSASSFSFDLRKKTLPHGSTHSESSTTSKRAFSMHRTKQPEKYKAPEKDVFDGFKISELKAVAQSNNVDLSGCVERGQIVNSLQEAGISPMVKKKGLLGSMKKSVTYDRSKDTSAPKVVHGKKRQAEYKPVAKDEFDGLSLSRLKQMACETNTDISSCIERSQICAALKKNGVKMRNTTRSLSPVRKVSPKVEKPKFKGIPFQGCTVAQLKSLAKESNVDVSSCVERDDIINKLKHAGIHKVPNLTRKDFSNWTVPQLRILTTVIKADLTFADDVTKKNELIDEVLYVANIKNPSLQMSLKAALGWATASLSELKAIARTKDVNISNCITKDDILACLLKKQCK